MAYLFLFFTLNKRQKYNMFFMILMLTSLYIFLYTIYWNREFNLNGEHIFNTIIIFVLLFSSFLEIKDEKNINKNKRNIKMYISMID